MRPSQSRTLTEDPLGLEGVGDPLVAGHHELLEELGRHERAVVVAHVLPPPGDVDRAAARDVLFDELEVHPGDVLHHLLDPVAVGHQGDGQVLEAHPVPEPAVEGAAVEEDGHPGGVRCLDGRPHVADPPRRVRIEPLVPQLLPVCPGFDGELQEMGHRGVVVEHLRQGALLGPDQAAAVPDLEGLLLEGREEAPVDGGLGDDLQSLEAEVALDVPVGPAFAREALLVPDGDRLVPVAELHVRDAVRLLPAEDLVESFPGGHGYKSSLSRIMISRIFIL